MEKKTVFVTVVITLSSTDAAAYVPWASRILYMCHRLHGNSVNMRVWNAEAVESTELQIEEDVIGIS